MRTAQDPSNYVSKWIIQYEEIRYFALYVSVTAEGNEHIGERLAASAAPSLHENDGNPSCGKSY